MRKRMDSRRGLVTCNNDAGAAVLLEIASDWFNPSTSVISCRWPLAGR
jgi:hypothetical protein